MSQKLPPRLTIANTNAAARSRAGIGAASTGPASATQRMMGLLQELNDRLRRDEAEREKLWREIDNARRAITDLEDKTEQAEKVFLNMENRMSRDSQNAGTSEKWKRLIEDNQKSLHAQLRKATELQSSLAKRVESVETTTGSAVIKIDDVLSEQSRLSRRLEAVSEDKTRLLRKMEGLEEALIQTQDTLRARALVLLTDQAVSGKGALPSRPAFDAAPPAMPQGEQMRMSAPEMRAPFVTAPRVETEEGISPLDLRHPAKIAADRKSKTQNIGVAIGMIVLLATVGGLAWYSAQKDRINLDTIQQQIASINNGGGTQALDPNLYPRLETEDAVRAAEQGTSATAPQGQDVQQQPQNATQVTGAIDPLASRAEYMTDEQNAVTELLSSAPQTTVAERIARDPSLPASAKKVEEQAFDGSGAAQHDLGAMYTIGQNGVKGSYSKAATWFEEASYNGVANARYNLGVLYQQGLGVKKDEAKAVELYKTASYLNHPEAQYNLGIAFIEGVGVAQDIPRAAYYFMRAADNSVIEAAYNLGLIYENGLLGLPQPDQAIYWYKASADKGNPDAIKSLDQLKLKMGLTDTDVNELYNRVAASRPQMTTRSTTPQGTQTNETLLPTNAETGATPAKAEPESITESAATPTSTGKTYDPGDEAYSPSKAAAAGKTATPTATKSAASSETVIETSPSFKPGSQAVVIAQIQEQLIKQGLYPGPADGVSGPQTEDAVRAYQAKSGLKVDGKASEDLLVFMLAKEFELGNYAKSGR
ncbi:MAG: peptidoglycan-binding protein [Pseudobdellovibrionaceae bacterium]